jgi:hypothetical protein
MQDNSTCAPRHGSVDSCGCSNCYHINVEPEDDVNFTGSSHRYRYCNQKASYISVNCMPFVRFRRKKRCFCLCIKCCRLSLKYRETSVSEHPSDMFNLLIRMPVGSIKRILTQWSFRNHSELKMKKSELFSDELGLLGLEKDKSSTSNSHAHQLIVYQHHQFNQEPRSH